jgi:ABC-type uncharacterized transport system involved in gliding motility auxiliary subunit
MNRTIRAIAAVILVAIIVFSLISVTQNLSRNIRGDITDQKLYTLSDGTKSILTKLNQPLTLKLYYAKTGVRKAPDQIRFYSNYYHFVEALLQEYARTSKDMVKLEIVDPRPFSTEEEDALRYGLKRFPIVGEENFFFGLVLQTQFGVVKTIPFFAPERQNFVEYDISHLIDTAITRQKERIGILSSLSVMGDDVTGYMAQLMQMQGKRPSPAWSIVEQLKQQYDVSKIESDVEDINNVDILMVIHPKKLPEKTLFAIDQFVLKGGRAIICVDPRCFADNSQGPMGRQQEEPASDLNQLLRTWGVEIPTATFAGDPSLAVHARVDQNERAQKLIGYLNLSRSSFDSGSVITANLNEVRMLFSGAILEVTDANGQSPNKVTPLVQTTSEGKTWQVGGPWDWIRINPATMMDYFINSSDSPKPVMMGCMITGKFKSSFPQGVEVTDEPAGDDKTEKAEPTTRTLTGLTKSSEDCVVVVFADVDFISDMVAYQNTFFGMKVPVANNSDLIVNTVDDLGGSSELIALRSRGNFQRPFTRVEKIRVEAEKKTAQEEADIKQKIAGFQQELQTTSAKDGQQDLVQASIVEKQRALEFKIRQAQKNLKDIQFERRRKIDHLGDVLQNANMLSAPAVILVIAIILSIRRSVLRRRYVSHSSDA